MSNPSHRIDMLRPVSGDWSALYLNGKLVAEGHNLPPDAVFDAISNVFPNKYHYNEISDEKAEDGFPQNLEDILPEYRFDLVAEVD